MSTATKWRKPEQVAAELGMSTREVRGLCASGQIAWRPRNPDARTPHYLISDEAVAEYVRRTTRPATVRPLRRAS